MLKRFIFFFLVFSIPFQLGYHFWLPETYVKSFRIDYLAPTLYLTDIFIILYLIFNLKTVFVSLRKYKRLFFLSLVFIFFNLLPSHFNLVSIFAWFRFFGYFLLYLVLRQTTDLKQKVRFPFLVSLIIVITLAFLQFIWQSSLGGLFYFLGERPLSVALPNVAKIGSHLLRPYSTFSHPNSLAGYLLVCLVILRIFKSPKVFKYLTTLAIILTFSKTAIFTLLIIQFVQVSLAQTIILSTILSLIPILKLSTSFSSRFYLFFPSFQIIANNLFAGVGLRQFIPSLANYLPGNQISYFTLQPVHNLFLLIIAELGLLPVFAMGLLIVKESFKLSAVSCQLITILLLTGALDHYWWTLPQNQLIIILAYALLSTHHSHRRWI